MICSRKGGLSRLLIKNGTLRARRFESIDHLFIHCPMPLGLWHRLFSLARIDLICHTYQKKIKNGFGMTVFGGRDDDYLLQGFENHAKKRFHGELQA